MASELAKRLSSLRKVLFELTSPKITAYTLRTTDAHNSEYLSDRDKRIAFISGFTGSNAIVVVTQSDAFLWTDGRYFDQAERELDSAKWKLMKMGVQGVASRDEWLAKNVKDNEKIGFDANLVSISEYFALEKTLNEQGADNVEIVSLQENPIDQIWGKDQPSLPSAESSKIFELDAQLYAGEEVKDKIERVRENLGLNAGCASVLVMNGLDEIAWLLNLRGSDIPYNPFFMSYLILSGEKVEVFLDNEKMTDVDIRIVVPLSHPRN